MGVKGLTSYVTHDAANFTQFHLHNTWVVIDAMNFIHFIYINSGLSTQFNGEYVDLKLAIVKVLRVFRQCRIRPVFVFDGCHVPAKLSTQLKRARDRLQTARSVVHLASFQTDAEHPSFCVPILPQLAPLVLAQTLSSLRYPFVVSDYESDEDAVGLAMHLHCPVISNDSDFYITIPADMPDTCLLPLRTLSWTPKPCLGLCPKCASPSLPTARKCYYVHAQRFILNGPAFGQLPPVQRPLFATLIGNDYVSPHRFASFLPCADGLKKALSGSATKTMRVNHRRRLYRAVINWLSGFNDDLRKPMQNLMHRIPTAQRHQAWCQLNQSLSSYRISVNCVQNSLLPFLNLDLENHTAVPVDDMIHDTPPGFVSPEQFFSSAGENSEYEQVNLECEMHEMNQLKSECTSLDSKTSSQSNKSITHSWPYSLLCRFRQYKILPLYLDALYSGGAVFNCSVEAVHECSSVYTCTDSIRLMLYGLLLSCGNQRERFAAPKTTDVGSLGMIESCGDCPKIVTEYVRKGAFQMRSQGIPVKAIRLDSVTTPVDNGVTFLQRAFSGKFNPNQPNIGWLHALALLSCIWLRYMVRGISETDPSRCPYLMAFVSISIVQLLSDLKASRSVNHDVDYLKREKRRLLTLVRYFHSLDTPEKYQHAPLNIYTVHVFGQLQAIFAALYSLGSTLDGLCGGQTSQNCFPLSNVSALFPSGRLYHALVGYLKRSSSEFGDLLVRREVLPRLVASHERVTLEDAICSLDTFLSLTQLFLGSFIEIKEVVVERHGSSRPLSSHKSTARKFARATDSQSKTKKRKTKHRTKQVSTPGLSLKELDAEINRIMLENDLTD